MSGQSYGDGVWAKSLSYYLITSLISYIRMSDAIFIVF